MSEHPRDACIWCGGDLDPSAVAGRLARCRCCGVETTHPFPTAKELDDAYETWYRPEGGRFSGPGDRVLGKARARLSKRLAKIAPAGPILDIGSGDGSLVAALRGRGLEAIGIERMEEADPSLESNAGGWAAVILWHTLEHLPDPGSRIDALGAELAPNGVVVIAVPNRDSLQARIFGTRWLHLDLPRHLVHLTAAALTQRLAQVGLRVERVSHLRGGQIVFGWLHGLVGLLPGAPNLYDAIRRPQARSSGIRGFRRVGALVAAVALLPAAVLLGAIEVALGRGGTVYVEARRV